MTKPTQSEIRIVFNEFLYHEEQKTVVDNLYTWLAADGYKGVKIFVKKGQWTENKI